MRNSTHRLKETIFDIRKKALVVAASEISRGQKLSVQEPCLGGQKEKVRGIFPWGIKEKRGHKFRELGKLKILLGQKLEIVNKGLRKLRFLWQGPIVLHKTREGRLNKRLINACLLLPGF